MAYAAVLSLTQILRQILDPDRPALHEKQLIESLQEKVSFLLDFLVNYSVHTDKVVKDLEIKIRDAAYEAEDIIESYVSGFTLYGRNRERRYRYPAFFQACVCYGGDSIGGFPTFCRDLDRVIEQTHFIQQEAMNIIKGKLGLNDVQQSKTLPVCRSRITPTGGTSSSTVGLVEDSMKIKDWLTSSSSKREVISIVGMGGIGKTTFARNLFDDSLTVYHFEVRAWVTVSQDYQVDEIIVGLLALVNELCPEMRKVSGGEPPDQLYKSLKDRRYLIMMDDVWDTKVWDEVKRFFPDDNNGSRIVLTTRLANVGAHASSSDYLHNMSLLSSNESWNLFCEKAFKGECCPPYLEEIGWQIMTDCKGHPLSIVVVGGLLSTDKTASYWKIVATTLNSILAKDGGQCSTIFSLSYSHLPAHLRPCFLYFANFPEDYDIPKSKLIKLWIAEGFMEANASKTLEDIAEAYLQDLLNRSLIMVLKLGHDGKVKTYRIHDLLREFCTTEAQKETFLHVTSRHTPNHSEGIRSERRISIQRFTPLKSIKYIFNSNGPPLPTRSIFFYHHYANIIINERSFGLLRVLDMGAGEIFPKCPMEVVRLVHLRYLSLCCSRAIVPASISSIWGLQTLVIHVFDDILYVDYLPMEVWTMPHLRHVQIKNNFGGLPDPPNSGVEGKNFVILANLQTLSYMIDFRFTDEIVKRIPKLKKLKLCYFIKFEDWQDYHLDNIVCLTELQTLELAFVSKLAFPPNMKFPAALKKLTLNQCHLRWEDLTMVGSLPNLEVLKLIRDACEGEAWEPNEGEFSELKFLELQNLRLVYWGANDSHFPQLKCLKIHSCFKLEEIPNEIGNIPTLEMIELAGASPSAVASARLILDEQRSFGNDALQVRIKEGES